MNNISFFMLLLLFLVLSVHESYAQTDSLYQEALEFYNQEDYKQAFKLFDELSINDSLNYTHFEKAGLSAYRLGNLSSAKKHFVELEKKDSSNLVAIKSLAAIFETEKNTPKTIKYYLRLTTLQPKNPIYYRKLGQQFQKAQLKTDAKKYYDKAYTLNPNDSYTINGLAELFLYEKKLIEADSILLLGLALDSTNINFNLLIANSKYRQRAYDSTAYYMKVIYGKYDLKPHQCKMLGYAYLQIDSLDLAINYLTRAINDDGTKEYAHYNIAIAYEKKGNMDYALYHFNKALEAGI